MDTDYTRQSLRVSTILMVTHSIAAISALVAFLSSGGIAYIWCIILAANLLLYQWPIYLRAREDWRR